MEHFNGGQVIFKEGDISNDKLYIIYYGTIILLRNQDLVTLQKDNIKEDTENTQYQDTIISSRHSVIQNPTNQNDLPLTQTSSSRYAKNINGEKKFSLLRMRSLKPIRPSSPEQSINLIQELTLVNQYGSINICIKIYSEIIRVLNAGDGFGEKALIENKPRALTAAVYSSEVYLLVLEKSDFSQVSQKFIEKMKLRKNLIFSIFHQVQDNYSSTRLESILYSCDELEFSKNNIIAEEGIEGLVFYILVDGEITLTKRDLEQDISICILNPYQLVGEEIIVNKNHFYEYNAIVTSSQATLLAIKLVDFHQKFPQESVYQILESYQKRKLIRQQFANLHQSSFVSFVKIQNIANTGSGLNEIDQKLKNKITHLHRKNGLYQSQSLKKFSITFENKLFPQTNPHELFLQKYHSNQKGCLLKSYKKKSTEDFTYETSIKKGLMKIISKEQKLGKSWLNIGISQSPRQEQVETTFQSSSNNFNTDVIIFNLFQINSQ